MEVLVHLTCPLGGEEHRVGIERAQHSVDRTPHQLLVVGRIDVVVLDEVEDLREQAELALQVVGGHQAPGEPEAEQKRQRHRDERWAEPGSTGAVHGA